MKTQGRVFLLPGEIVFAREPLVLSTLLGSCVAVCLYDRRNHWGGMNHFMLPGGTDRSRGSTPGKYGDLSIPRLLLMAERAGCRRRDLVASVCGGSQLSSHLDGRVGPDWFDVGRRNIEIACTLLEQHRIRIVMQDTGGAGGRKIFMDSATNRITVDRHGATSSPAPPGGAVAPMVGRRRNGA